MRKILVCTADRAEKGLLDPVVSELEKIKNVEVFWSKLASSFTTTQNIGLFRSDLIMYTPDIVVVPCDRNEMVYVAADAFHEGYVVAHFHAGNNLTNHPDDFNRRAISLFSHIMLCNMPEHKQNLINQGEEEWRIHVVGSTAFDNIEHDLTVTPTKPFDLVILHPDPTSIENTIEDLRKTQTVTRSTSRIVWIYPNSDKNNEIITVYLDQLKIVDKYSNVYKNLPRNQYFALLKHCTRAIGNSSSFYYELPVINPSAKFIQIGERNKGLIVPKTETGGAKRIAELLSTIELTEQLHNKKFGAHN